MTDSVPPAEIPAASASPGDPVTPAAPAPDKKAPRPRGPRRWPSVVLGLVLGAALVGFGGWANEQWRAQRAAPEAAARDAALQSLQAAVAAADAERDALRRDLSAARTESTRLAERFTALEGTGGDAATRATALQAQLGALATRMDELRNAPPPAAAVDPAALAALERRMTAVETAAAAAPAGTPDATGRAAADALAQRLADTERALNDLREAPAVAPQVAETRALADALSRQVTQLQARADQAEQRSRAADPAAARGAVVVTATQLRERMRGPDSFEAELNAFRAAAGATDAALKSALDSVAPIAARGAATLEQLRRSFDAAADDALVQIGTPAEGWTGALLRGMRDLVRVRRTADVAGDNDPARVTRARAALAREDLPAAMRELGGATTALRNAMAGWIAQAGARAVVDQASQAVGAHAVALVAGVTP